MLPLVEDLGEKFFWNALLIDVPPVVRSFSRNLLRGVEEWDEGATNTLSYSQTDETLKWIELLKCVYAVVPSTSHPFCLILIKLIRWQLFRLEIRRAKATTMLTAYRKHCGYACKIRIDLSPFFRDGFFEKLIIALWAQISVNNLEKISEKRWQFQTISRCFCPLGKTK